LIWLFKIEPNLIRKWIESDKQIRLREFSPSAVRKALEDSSEAKSVFGENWVSKLCLDKDWYSSLCELYTHVTPITLPNAHNEENHGVVGGLFQEQGVQECLNHLFNALLALTIPICGYFDFDDIFKKLKTHADSLRKVGL
jgi:hypothetical protein